MQDLQNVLPVLILVLTDINERLIEFGGSQQQENATNFEKNCSPLLRNLSMFFNIQVTSK